VKLLHLFLPHPTTHHKAHLLRWHALLIYILLFILLQVGFSLVNTYKPGVLGINSEITVQQVIDGTNVERQKLGLPPLHENLSLSKAAQAKAQNMFAENYWAHFSPSGKDPWGFIVGSGYHFSYAGENLARNFYTSDEVVKALMNSPTHRANLLNPHYQDIGIAVVDGVLLGQKTTLIVQEFGTPYEAIAKAPQIDLSGKTTELTAEQLTATPQIQVAGTEQTNVPKAVIDPYKTVKVLAMILVTIIGSLLIIDFIVLRRRGVFRFSSHHFAHLMLVMVIITAVAVVGVGSVL
jgi:hypothetical protein